MTHNWLDKLVFGKECLDRWDAERKGNQSSAVNPMGDYNKVEEFEDGIFSCKETKNGDSFSHWTTLERIVEGKIIEFGKENFNFDCYYVNYNFNQTIFSGLSNDKGYHEKEIPKIGTYFILKTSKGTGQIEIPRQFSEEEIKNIINQEIKHYYSKEKYEETYEGCGDNESNKYEYKMDVLSGPLKGKIFEERIR